MASKSVICGRGIEIGGHVAGLGASARGKRSIESIRRNDGIFRQLAEDSGLCA
jgi:hypothetical protein